MDLGADRRGVDMGPSAIRYGGLADGLDGVGVTCRDGGDLPVPRPESVTDADSLEAGRTKYLDATAEVCERVATAVDEAVATGEFLRERQRHGSCARTPAYVLRCPPRAAVRTA